MRDLLFMEKALWVGTFFIILVFIFGGWLMTQVIIDWKAPPALIGEGVFQEKTWRQVKLSGKIYEIPLYCKFNEVGVRWGDSNPLEIGKEYRLIERPAQSESVREWVLVPKDDKKNVEKKDTGK